MLIRILTREKTRNFTNVYLLFTTRIFSYLYRKKILKIYKNSQIHNSHKDVLKKLFLLLFFSFFPFGLPAAIAAPALNEDIQQIDLTRMMSVFDPAGRTLSPEDLDAPTYRDQFKPLSADLAAGFGGPLWLRIDLTVAHGGGGQWWLEFGPPYVNSVRLYSKDKNGSYSYKEAGSQVAPTMRDLAYRNPVFFLDLEERQEPQHLYVLLQTKTTRALFATLWRPPAFATSKLWEGLLFGIFFGGLIITALSNAIFGLYLKTRLYLVYAAYVFCSALTQSLGMGFAATWLPLSLFHPLVGMGMALGIGFGAEMLRVARADLHYPRLFRDYVNISWILAIGASLIAVSGAFQIASPLIQATYFAQAVFTCIISYKLLRKGEAAAYYYLGAFLVQILSAPVFIAHNAGLIEGNSISRNILPFSTYLHIILMNLAVIRQVKTMREERKRAQDDLVRHLRHSEHSLEIKVAQRTRALESEISRRRIIEQELSVAHDKLTEALKTEREAWESQRQFFLTVSHDFGAPLGILEAGLHAPGPAHPRRQQQMQRAVAELIDIVEQCLVIERFESSGAFFPKPAIPLQDIIDYAAKRTQRLAAEHSLLIQPAAPGLHVAGDELWLQMMLANVMTNAIVHTAPGTQVSLVAAQRLEWIDIVVRDNGEGMPEDELAQLFTRFRRGRHAKAKGSGLGLYLVRQIAQRHGGVVEVANIVPHGLEIRISLPRADASRIPDATNGGAA
ncbi:signal transduction histidine kinase [Herbaspirillum sp. SJZ130]|nr:signal transduction histidine kinase [Herbaspirillum sp. SJZ130]TQK08457.1 signal transduction histidine kinase [Herbaspirillum sp. SJZ106]